MDIYAGNATTLDEARRIFEPHLEKWLEAPRIVYTMVSDLIMIPKPASIFGHT